MHAYGAQDTDRLGVLLLGVAATGDGALTRVPLAVLTLTALASFEVVTALPAAAVQLGQARVSGRRIAAVLDAPDPVRAVASVLLRFAELAAGTATLNGHDLASYSADDLRTRIGGCPQDPHIFDASLRDNLRLARPEATDEQLAGAAARAGLLDWIGSLPLGWDTPAGARGAALSEPCRANAGRWQLSAHVAEGSFKPARIGG